MKKLELALEKMEASLKSVSVSTADRLVAEAGTLIEEYIEKNQPKKTPKKTPYTAETFPDNAIWIRPKNTNCKYVINIVDKHIFFINYYKCVINVGFDEIDDYEICFLTRNHNIEWRPFYIEE